MLLEAMGRLVEVEQVRDAVQVDAGGAEIGVVRQQIETGQQFTVNSLQSAVYSQQFTVNGSQSAACARDVARCQL